MEQVITILIIALIIYVLSKWWNSTKSLRWKQPKTPFPLDWRVILIRNVPFYNALSETEKTRFEYKIQEFLLNCRITGIDTVVDSMDKILVASSAIIPIFEFKEWTYSNIHEVLLYPSMFN